VRALAPLVLAPFVAALGACAGGDFWDRPYGVAGRSGGVARAPAPPPPAAAPGPAAARPPPVAWEAPSLPAPPPAPPSPPSSRTSCGATAEDLDALDAVNRIREARGLRPFRWDDRLYVAARDHSAEQRLHRYMGHGSPDAARDDLGDRVRLAGYRGSAWAEVVAMGYPDVPAVVDAWMRSPSHREILLDPRLEEAGFSRDGAYWTGNFGAPLRAAPGPTTAAPRASRPPPSTVRSSPPPSPPAPPRAPVSAPT
jgi:uncharacterized protein YkwD